MTGFSVRWRTQQSRLNRRGHCGMRPADAINLIFQMVFDIDYFLYN